MAEGTGVEPEYPYGRQFSRSKTVVKPKSQLHELTNNNWGTAVTASDAIVHSPPTARQLSASRLLERFENCPARVARYELTKNECEQDAGTCPAQANRGSQLIRMLRTQATSYQKS